jgi:selenocysteine-specific elongation factor
VREGRFAQLRLREPVVAARGDRVVLRTETTVGGGVVLDPAPRRHGPSRDLLARLARRERGEPEPVAAEVAAPAPRAASPPPLSPAALALEAELRAAGWEPPAGGDPALLAALRAHGRAVRLGRDMHVHPDALAAVEARLVALAERDGEVTLAGLRDALGTSRKYAQALLEHFDAARVTLRVGDARVLRSGARAGRPRGGGVG